MKRAKRERSETSEKKQYLVHGTITEVSGKELSGAEVIVSWQRMRERLQLGKGRSSEEGRYRIRYSLPEDVLGQVLIVVEVRSKRLHPPLESPLTPAQPDLQIDLAAQPRDSSEFATLLRAIKAQLDRIPLLDVVENAEHHDISFLAQEIGKSAEQIMRIVVASRLEKAYSISAAAFYAFIRQRVPAALPSPLLDATQDFTLIDALVARVASLIFGLSAEVQTRTLNAAVGDKLIGPQVAAQIPELVGQLQALHTTNLLSQPYLIGKATLGQNSQSMRNFWRTLGDGQHGFTASEASGIERTLSVGAFVKNHVPLVQILLQRFAAGTYKSLSDLAHLTQEEWIQLVNQSGPPPSIDSAGVASPAEVFARVVYTRVTRAFPTVALASRVTTGSIVPPVERAPLHQFFLNNAALDLIRNNLAVSARVNDFETTAHGI